MQKKIYPSLVLLLGIGWYYFLWNGLGQEVTNLWVFTFIVVAWFVYWLIIGVLSDHSDSKSLLARRILGIFYFIAQAVFWILLINDSLTPGIELIARASLSGLFGYWFQRANKKSI